MVILKFSIWIKTLNEQFLAKLVIWWVHGGFLLEFKKMDYDLAL